MRAVTSWDKNRSVELTIGVNMRNVKHGWGSLCSTACMEMIMEQVVGLDESQEAKEIRGAIPTPMLDVVFRDGKVRSFSYAYLAEVEFEPGDTLTLNFTSGATIIVEGRGLSRLRQAVRLHRADEIRECSERELETEGEEITQVANITITEAD